jgi:hypothetical protein
MATWHATLTFTLAAKPLDTTKLAEVLHTHDGTAHVDGRTLTVDLFLRSAHITSLPSAARLATYVARRAIFAAGATVAAQDGLTVVLAPAPGPALAGAGSVAHAEPV